MNFVQEIFELHFLLQPQSGSLLKNDWLEIGGLSCNSSFQLLKIHEENWNSAVPRLQGFARLDSRLIHCDTMQQSLRHLFGLGR